MVQLRRDNAEGSMYNLVGFQTHLKFGSRSACFHDPRAANAEFVRYGVMHRNTYLNSPVCWTAITGSSRTTVFLCRADDRRGGLRGVHRRPASWRAWRRRGG